MSYTPTEPIPVYLDGVAAEIIAWDDDFEGAYAYLIDIEGPRINRETWVHWPSCRVTARTLPPEPSSCAGSPSPLA